MIIWLLRYNQVSNIQKCTEIQTGTLWFGVTATDSSSIRHSRVKSISHRRARPRVQSLGLESSGLGFPLWSSGLESACQGRGCGFKPCSRKIPHASEPLGRAPQLLSLRSRTRSHSTEARVPRSLCSARGAPALRAWPLPSETRPARCN